MSLGCVCGVDILEHSITYTSYIIQIYGCRWDIGYNCSILRFRWTAFGSFGCIRSIFTNGIDNMDGNYREVLFFFTIVMLIYHYVERIW